MKRVLLTGAGGFVGHHCLEHLLVETDWQIVCLDSFRHRGKTDRIREVLEGLAEKDGVRGVCASQYDDRVEVIPHDLRVPISAQLDQQIGPISYVLSIASESHVDRSCVEPRPFIENNVALVLTLLEWTRHRARLGPDSIQKFLHVSTDEVYGPAPAGHNHVEGEPHLPSNPYSASKACQEDIVYSYWRTFGLPVGISNCWDMETRLLTSDGLRGYDEVEVGDLIWTLDADERMTLEPVLGKVRMRGPSRMVQIDGHAEQVVTPNHRVMLRRSVGQTRIWGQIEEVQAETLVGMSGRVAIPRSGAMDWVGDDAAETETTIGTVATEWLARIYAWYITEGCISGTTVALGAGTEPQAQEMEHLLDGFGNVYRNGRSVRVANRQLAELLGVAGHGSRQKRVPEVVRRMAPVYLQAFLDAAIEGDGTRYGTGAVIYTVNELLAADYAEVAMKCGYAVRISERDTKLPRKDEMVHSYIVRLSDRRDSMIEAKNVREVAYDGDVWCVRVPSGRVFAEHGGAISLTGQTMNIIGERQDPEKFVPLVLSRIAAGERVPIHATTEGRPGSRYYLHARNQADALLFLLRTQPFLRYGDTERHRPTSDSSGNEWMADLPAGMGRWNVVGEREIDNLTMAQMISEYAGAELLYDLVDFHSSRPGHDARYALDGTKMRELGWLPPVPLEESLERTIRWSLAHPQWLLDDARLAA